MRAIIHMHIIMQFEFAFYIAKNDQRKLLRASAVACARVGWRGLRGAWDPQLPKTVRFQS